MTLRPGDFVVYQSVDSGSHVIGPDGDVRELRYETATAVACWPAGEHGGAAVWEHSLTQTRQLDAATGIAFE